MEMYMTDLAIRGAHCGMLSVLCQWFADPLTASRWAVTSPRPTPHPHRLICLVSPSKARTDSPETLSNTIPRGEKDSATDVR